MALLPVSLMKEIVLLIGLEQVKLIPLDVSKARKPFYRKLISLNQEHSQSYSFQ